MRSNTRRSYDYQTVSSLVFKSHSPTASRETIIACPGVLKSGDFDVENHPVRTGDCNLYFRKKSQKNRTWEINTKFGRSLIPNTLVSQFRFGIIVLKSLPTSSVNIKEATFTHISLIHTSTYQYPTWMVMTQSLRHRIHLDL